MKSCFICAKTFLLFILVSAVQAHDTQFQTVGTIEMEDNGTIKVYTPEFSNQWDVTNGSCADQSSITISNSTTARDQWLSMLLFAKASGLKVRFLFTTCNSSVAGPADEVNIK